MMIMMNEVNSEDCDKKQ